MGCVAFAILHLQLKKVVEEEQEAVERNTSSFPVGTVHDLGTTLSMLSVVHHTRSVLS